jgi:hypothetical protein
LDGAGGVTRDMITSFSICDFRFAIGKAKTTVSYRQLQSQVTTRGG